MIFTRRACEPARSNNCGPLSPPPKKGLDAHAVGYYTGTDTPRRTQKLRLGRSGASRILLKSEFHTQMVNCGPGSSVGIATDYGLDGPESNPGGDEIFRPSRPTLGPTQPSVKMGTESFSGVKCGRGVLLTTHSLLVLRSRKSRAIPLPTLRATRGL